MRLISFPFVYLDSSTLMRSNINPKILTRKAAINNTKEFVNSLNNIVQLSNMDDNYYKSICKLIEENLINRFITYESINKMICEDDFKKIFLFVKKTLHCNYSEEKDWILWNEEISHSKFYEAAMAIADSQCVVIDSKFISLDVGKSLMNYITSKCTVFFVGNITYNNIENAKVISSSPLEFIEELAFRCN